MKKTKTTVQFTVRLPEGLYAEFFKLAAREDRSLNNMASRLIREALEAKRKPTYSIIKEHEKHY